MHLVHRLFFILSILCLLCSEAYSESLINGIEDTTTSNNSLSLSSKEGSKDNIEVKFSGVLRFSYNYSDWKEGQKRRGGDFGYDVFALKTDAVYNDFFLSADYRFYSSVFGGPFLKHGFIGYNFNETDNIQIGLANVPFGITKYNSNSWFFSLACYAGFEDDSDMGIKYSHVSDSWEYSLAFFKNAEEYNYGSNSDISYSRYGYDVSSVDVDGDGTLEYRNKEVNQLNGQLFYNIRSGEFHHRLGASVQYSGIYNLDTEDIGDHNAYALHYELTVKGINFRAQTFAYEYNPETPEGEDDNVIAVGAYGAPYLIAAKAQIHTLGLSYTIPIKNSPINSIMIYNDYGYMSKKSDDTIDLYDSAMNVAGVAISAGPIYTYIDYAMGKNQSWLGPEWTNAFGQGSSNEGWSARFNINVGYYF